MIQLPLVTDLSYGDIADITVEPERTWTILGNPEEMSHQKDRGGLGYYFAQGGVDGAAVLLTEEQDKSLVDRLFTDLQRWWITPGENADAILPCEWIPDQTDIVIARWPLPSGQALWVVAENDGNSHYERIQDILSADGAIEIFQTSHMQLNYEAQVKLDNPLIWGAICELGVNIPQAIASPKP